MLRRFSVNCGELFVFVFLSEAFCVDTCHTKRTRESSSGVRTTLRVDRDDTVATRALPVCKSCFALVRTAMAALVFFERHHLTVTF